MINHFQGFGAVRTEGAYGNPPFSQQGGSYNPQGAPWANYPPGDRSANPQQQQPMQPINGYRQQPNYPGARPSREFSASPFPSTLNEYQIKYNEVKTAISLTPPLSKFEDCLILTAMIQQGFNDVALLSEISSSGDIVDLYTVFLEHSEVDEVKAFAAAMLEEDHLKGNFVDLNSTDRRKALKLMHEKGARYVKKLSSILGIDYLHIVQEWGGLDYDLSAE
jgi:hypothetical protein